MNPTIEVNVTRRDLDFARAWGAHAPVAYAVQRAIHRVAKRPFRQGVTSVWYDPQTRVLMAYYHGQKHRVMRDGQPANFVPVSEPVKLTLELVPVL